MNLCPSPVDGRSRDGLVPILDLAARFYQGLAGPGAKRQAGLVVQVLQPHECIVHLDADAAHDDRLAPSRAPELPLQETWIFPHKDCHPETNDANNVCLSNFCEPSSSETGDFGNSEAVAVNQLKQPSESPNHPETVPNYHHLCYTCLYVTLALI